MNQKLIFSAVLSVFIFSQTIFAFKSQYIKIFSVEDSSRVIENKTPENQNREAAATWHQMFTNLPSDYYQLIKSSFSEKELPVLADVAVLTGSLMAIDQKGWKYQNLICKKSCIDRGFSNASVKLGNGGYQFAFSALFAATGVIFNNDAYLKTASNVTEAVLSTGLFVQLLKRTTGRQSPAASTERGGEWSPFPSIKKYQKNQAAFYSFPSGHLSTATAVLTVIANNYPSEKWIKPVGYPLLGALGISLVNKGMHWYSDFPLALFLGNAFGNIIVPLEENNLKDGQSSIKPSLTILPVLKGKSIDLSAVYAF
jgi:hypothetical protein